VSDSRAARQHIENRDQAEQHARHQTLRGAMVALVYRLAA
jgi:hypothetical protein